MARARTSKAARSQTKKANDAEPQPLKARLVLHLSDDIATYYVNFIEVASSSNEFSMYGAQIPTKPSAEAIEEARKSGDLHITADIQIVFPVTIIQNLIDALSKQQNSYCKQFGDTIKIRRGNEE